MSFTFQRLEHHYSEKLKRMGIHPQWKSAINRAANTIRKNEDKYRKVEEATGVPWAFIASLHWREASGNFSGVLHNGEKIIGSAKKTSLVPAGRGPFSSWEEAAIDALLLKRLDLVKDWSLERVCYEAERFNGFGYQYKELPSPYLWSGTNQYVRGKYIADRKFSPIEVDQQLGVIALYLKLLNDNPTTVPGIPRIETEKTSLITCIRVTAKTLLGAITGLFTLENFTNVKEWVGLAQQIFTPTLFAGLVIGGLLFWLFSNLLEMAQKQEAVETDTPLKGDDDAI